MDRRAVEKAESRLRIAQKALAGLEESQNYRDFADQWHVFLTSAKGVYTVLEQGAKVSPQSRQWFVAKKTIRKNDPLLQYIFEARNDDEHGLGTSVNLQPERHEIGMAGEGCSSSIRLDGGPFQNVHISGGHTALVIEGAPPPGLRVTSLDNKPILSRHKPAAPILVEITARGNRKYAPPTSHLGHQLGDTSPLHVAKVAVDYLSGLVKEAAGLA